MRNLVLAATLTATAAWAGEVLLGTLKVTDGGTVANRTTGTPFLVPSNALLSIQCNEDSYVLTDAAGVDAGTGIKLSAGMLLPTSVNSSKTLTGYASNPDGGAAVAVTYTGGWVASAPASGATSTCRVFSRSGQE